MVDISSLGVKDAGVEVVSLVDYWSSSNAGYTMVPMELGYAGVSTINQLKIIRYSQEEERRCP